MAYAIQPFIEYKDTNGFLQQRPFTLLHNHELDELVIDGYVLIKREYDFIASNALTYPRIAKLKHALENKCGRRDGRDYCQKLLTRVINWVFDQHFGKDRHQLPELRKTDKDIIARGGVWEEDIDDRRQLIGTHRQTPTQRELAFEYGGYFVETDGTHSTNKYGLIAKVDVSVDCLGKSIIVGVSTMQSENALDNTKSSNLFGLSSRQEGESKENPGEVLIIDDVPVNNRVLQNSFRGTMLTDEGPWSDTAATVLNKVHGLCRKHKSSGIHRSRKGLGSNTIIYRNHTPDSLNSMIESALDKYGHEEKPKTFISSIKRKQHKICHTYMKHVFTHGHSTT
jgi:hypothetical protein